MKQQDLKNKSGFTLAEMLVCLSAASLLLATVMLGSVALEKSFNATDNFFGAHMQEIRIIDYLSRDVRRSYIVTASTDKKTVTCVIPNYFNGDVRATPTVQTTVDGTIVSYPYSRTVADAVTTSGSPTLTSATANFTTADVGTSVAGVNIPAGTTIQSVTNSTTVTLSNNATADASGATETLGGTTVVYSIAGNSIVRTENGTVTNIASSTDQILPSTTDVTLLNTEYTPTQVTFQPIFTSGNSAAENTGTTIFSTTYLRNKRRG